MPVRGTHRSATVIVVLYVSAVPRHLRFLTRQAGHTERPPLFALNAQTHEDEAHSQTTTCNRVTAGSSKWFQHKMDLAMHWGTYTYNRQAGRGGATSEDADGCGPKFVAAAAAPALRTPCQRPTNPAPSPPSANHGLPTLNFPPFPKKLTKTSGRAPRDIRDLVACGAACGVCTAFKAPVGGVFFAMEMSTRWVDAAAGPPAGHPWLGVYHMGACGVCAQLSTPMRWGPSPNVRGPSHSLSPHQHSRRRQNLHAQAARARRAPHAAPCHAPAPRGRQVAQGADVALLPRQRDHDRGGAVHRVDVHRARPLQQPAVRVARVVQSGVPLALLGGGFLALLVWASGRGFPVCGRVVWWCAQACNTR